METNYDENVDNFFWRTRKMVQVNIRFTHNLTSLFLHIIFYASREKQRIKKTLKNKNRVCVNISDHQVRCIFDQLKLIFSLHKKCVSFSDLNYGKTMARASKVWHILLVGICFPSSLSPPNENKFVATRINTCIQVATMSAARTHTQTQWDTVATIKRNLITAHGSRHTMNAFWHSVSGYSG